MAIVNKSTIKNWFKNGLIPGQSQFWDWVDSFRHLNDKVPVGDIEGIDAVLLAKADKEALTNHLADTLAHHAEFSARELIENKVDNVGANLGSSTKFPSVKGIIDWIYANVYNTPFLGAAVIGVAPTGTGAGYWITTVPGTYPLYGGVVVNSNSLAVIIRDAAGVFTISQNVFDFKDPIKVIRNYLTPTASATVTIGGTVTTDNSQLYLLDRAIKEVTVYNTPTENVILKTMYFTKSGENYVINASVAFVDDLFTDVTDINTLPYSTVYQTDYTSTGYKEVFFHRLGVKGTVRMVIDTSVFGDVTHDFKFQTAGGISAGYKRSGLQKEKIKYITPNRLISNHFNLVKSGTISYIDDIAYRLNSALVDVQINSTQPKMAQISLFSVIGTEAKMSVEMCDFNPEMLINSTKSGYMLLTAVVDITVRNTKKVVAYKNTQNSSTNGSFEAVIDFSKFSNIDANATKTASTPAHFFVGATSGVKLAYSYHFTENKYYTSPSGGIIADAGYISSGALTIPSGSQFINFTGTVDAKANIGFLNNKGKLIGWGYQNGDGSKYSGGVALTNGSFAIPAGTRYVLPSFTIASAATAALTLTGSFKKENSFVKEGIDIYNSINEAQFDVNKTGLVNAGAYLLKKNAQSVVLPTTIGSANLEAIPDLKIGSGFIIPVHGAITGGKLCAIDKNGVMYFYNMNLRTVFKSTDGGATFITICNATTNPEMFSVTGTQGDGRVHIIALDNGELLIPTRLEGELFGPDMDRRELYWTLWRTSSNQTVFTKVLTFSHEHYIRDLDAPGSPQYNWTAHSSGCLLSDWTSDTKDNLVVITEYGHGLPRWAYEQGETNNGLGVSSRAWVSFDYGATFKKMFDFARKIDGNNANEADDNWYYFNSKADKQHSHIHCVHIDRPRNMVWLTNGDGPNILAGVKISDLESWYPTAPVLNVNESPIYKNTDTFPNWITNIIGQRDVNEPCYIDFANKQYTAIFGISNGLLLGHDARREYAVICHDESIKKGDFVLDFTYNFERPEYFPDNASYQLSKQSTDGFVQNICRRGANDPIYFLHSGIRGRILATYDGINFKQVYVDSDGSTIKFGSKLLFDKIRNKIYLVGDLDTASNLSGYYEIKEVF